MLFKFRKNLYSSSCTLDNISICDVVYSLITKEDNLMLTIVSDDSEIKAVVCSLDPSSASCPDGFPRDLIRKNLISCVHFFRCNWLMPSFNWNFIALILEVKGDLANFGQLPWPIFFLKSLWKILANRLSFILSWIISPLQRAFIKTLLVLFCLLI